MAKISGGACRTNSGRFTGAARCASSRGRRAVGAYATPNAVLAAYYGTRRNIRVYSGDAQTGRPWGDVAMGRVSKSTGTKPVYLIVRPGAYGSGEAYSTDPSATLSIVKIEATPGGAVLYQHPKFPKPVKAKIVIGTKDVKLFHPTWQGGKEHLAMNRLDYRGSPHGYKTVEGAVRSLLAIAKAHGSTVGSVKIVGKR